ncbi:uncharacterized protein METZ01_LOCUS404462, partial [marine metagenome]
STGLDPVCYTLTYPTAALTITALPDVKKNAG